jgi:hypothetical protein
MTIILIIVMYLCLAGIFALWGLDILDSEIGKQQISTPSRKMSAMIFGLFFPVVFSLVCLRWLRRKW